MLRYLAKSALLIGISVVVVCGIYPGALWVIGQTLFPFGANGSIVHDDSGKVIGSLLVAQPFTKDEYFQPRPSAASFDATASTSSGYAPSNYALRDRVARALGPIVTYADGDKKGQLVAPDVEAWFKADKAGGNPHIVAQWADAHNSIAQAWVTGDPTHAAYVDAWAKAHDEAVKDWIKKNPATPQPKASDLAVLFFETFSNDHPGMFPSSVTKTGPDGKSVTDIDPVSASKRVLSTGRSASGLVAVSLASSDRSTAGASASARPATLPIIAPGAARMMPVRSFLPSTWANIGKAPPGGTSRRMSRRCAMASGKRLPEIGAHPFPSVATTVPVSLPRSIQ